MEASSLAWVCSTWSDHANRPKERGDLGNIEPIGVGVHVNTQDGRDMWCHGAGAARIGRPESDARGQCKAEGAICGFKGVFFNVVVGAVRALSMVPLSSV